MLCCVVRFGIGVLEDCRICCRPSSTVQKHFGSAPFIGTDIPTSLEDPVGGHPKVDKKTATLLEAMRLNKTLSRGD